MLGKNFNFEGQIDIFPRKLSRIINMEHELSIPGQQIDCTGIEEQLSQLYSLEGKPSILLINSEGLLMSH